MIRGNKLKQKSFQVYSLVIKDLKLKLLWKNQFIVEYFIPLLYLFFPFIIFNTLFEVSDNPFGTYFTTENYPLFLLLAYCVECLIYLIWNYRDAFMDEKIWLTLKGLMVAPISKFQLYLAYLISGLISKSFPIIFVTILCYVFYPIPFINLLFVIFVFTCVSVTFASIGFMVGLFEIVNENISGLLTTGISFISLVSCLFYPITIFPEFLQIFILLNPLYYFFDLLRLSWWLGLNPSDAMQYITIDHLLIVISVTIFLPIFACYLFIKLYNKYGARGY